MNCTVDVVEVAAKQPFLAQSTVEGALSDSQPAAISPSNVHHLPVMPLPRQTMVKPKDPLTSTFVGTATATFSTPKSSDVARGPAAANATAPASAPPLPPQANLAQRVSSNLRARGLSNSSHRRSVDSTRVPGPRASPYIPSHPPPNPPAERLSSICANEGANDGGITEEMDRIKLHLRTNSPSRIQQEAPCGAPLKSKHPSDAKSKSNDSGIEKSLEKSLETVSTLHGKTATTSSHSSKHEILKVKCRSHESPSGSLNGSQSTDERSIMDQKSPTQIATSPSKYRIFNPGSIFHKLIDIGRKKSDDRGSEEEEVAPKIAHAHRRRQKADKRR